MRRWLLIALFGGLGCAGISKLDDYTIGGGGQGGAPGGAGGSAPPSVGGAGGATGGMGGDGAAGGGGDGGAGGSGPSCAVAFEDTFDGSVLSQDWQALVDSGASIAQQSGVLTMTVTEQGYNHGINLTTQQTYALDACGIQFEIVGTPPADDDAFVFVSLRRDNNNLLYLRVQNGVFTQALWAGGSYIELGTLPYDPVAHRWWRWRATPGGVAYEASPDGSSWTQLAELSPLPFALDAAVLRFGAKSLDWAPTWSVDVDNVQIERITP